MGSCWLCSPWYGHLADKCDNCCPLSDWYCHAEVGEDSVVVDSTAEGVGHQRMIEDKTPGDFGTAGRPDSRPVYTHKEEQGDRKNGAILALTMVEGKEIVIE